MIPIIVTHWDQDKQKLYETETHLKEQGIESWSYFFGFPGRGLRSRNIEGERYYGSPEDMLGAAIGQNLTHWHLWAALKMCSEQNPKGATCWNIVEDDIRLQEGWRQIYNDVREDIPKDWDIIFFGNGYTSEQTMIHVTGPIYKGAALCLHWYCVRHKALDTLLETNKFIRTRMDIQMLLESYKHLNCYTVLPRLADQAHTYIAP